MIKQGNTYNWDFLSLTRFLLAFIVLSGHLSGNIDHAGPLNVIMMFGSFEAILGFLLISGFSIGKSILKNQDHYFLRRAERIYPVYLASMILKYALFPQALSPEFIGMVFINIIFLNQLVTATSYVGPAWSLALEVWLYALAPLFLKASYRLLIILIYTSFAAYCIYTCSRTLLHLPYYAGTMYGVNLLFLSFIWIAGFTLAVHADKAKAMALHIGALFLAHFSLSFLIKTGFRIKNDQIAELVQEDLLLFLCKLICLSLIYTVVIYNHKLPSLSLQAKKIFNFLGNISYPLYLIHLTVITFCLKKQLTTNWFLLTGICLAVASLIYLSVDFYSKKRKVA